MRPQASGRNEMVKVIRSSSVNNSQNTVVAKFETREEARQYIADNTVDGVNVSSEIDCDYLRIDGDDE
jgi:2-methylaconitate cis-trans-isomerase PrpF